MHGVETFAEVLCAIDRLTEAQGDATIGIAFLTTPTSACVEGIADCVKLARELGADYAQFRPLLKTANGRERPWIYTQRHRQLIDALREAEKLSTPEFRVDFNEEKYRRIEGAEVKPYSRCGFVEIAPAISASGNVSVCCHHMEREEFLIGNIHEHSFEDLWYSQTKA